MENLKTIEDCFVAVGEDFTKKPIVDHLPEKRAKKVIADYFLPIVIEAINKSIPADWNNSDERKYSPWFEVIKDETKASGFCLSYYDYGYSNSRTDVGSRLTFRTVDGLEYAVKKFPELFEEVYL